MKSAVDCLEKMHLTAKERIAYDQYWDAISNERSLLSGKLAEGEEIGVMKEKKAYISQMLDEGLDIYVIARCSRITVEEVKQIVEKINKEKEKNQDKNLE